MTPLPEPAVTIVLVDKDGCVKVATNVAPNAQVKVTTSKREFEILSKGIHFRPDVVR